jgi:hypothetical protein
LRCVAVTRATRTPKVRVFLARLASLVVFDHHTIHISLALEQIATGSVCPRSDGPRDDDDTSAEFGLCALGAIPNCLLRVRIERCMVTRWGRVAPELVRAAPWVYI